MNLTHITSGRIEIASSAAAYKNLESINQERMSNLEGKKEKVMIIKALVFCKYFGVIKLNYPPVVLL